MAFQGSLSELPIPDIVQLVSVSGKTGVFELQQQGAQGRIYLRDGQIEHAVSGVLDGEEAIYDLASWSTGEFVFTQGVEPPGRTIEKSNTNLLMEAARRIDEWKVLSKRIPSTRHVPVLQPGSLTTAVSFSAPEWRVVSKVDGQRTIEQIALTLGQSPYETAKVLYGLLTSGLVLLRRDIAATLRPHLQALSQEELLQLIRGIHSSARGLLADDAQRNRLDRSARLIQLGASGREIDAVLELVRSHEQALLSTIGEEGARTFVDSLPDLAAESGS